MASNSMSVLDMSSAMGPAPPRQDNEEDTGNESTSAPKICANCKKSETETSKPHKRCAKCQSQSYCSRECQKADWKVHKKCCATLQQNKPNATTNFDAMPKQAGDFFKNIVPDDYLHRLPQTDAFTHLIDCYRMRVEDDYKFAAENRGLYAGEDPLEDFQEFLDLAEKRKGVLPKWWSAEKREECEHLAVDQTKWSVLSYAVEKHDIIEHYGDNMMPMKLRLLAEKIYGKKINTGF